MDKDAQATQGASSPDLAAQVSQLASLMGQLADSQKQVLDVVGKLASPAAQPHEAMKPLTAEDVGKVVLEHLNAHNAGQAKRNARDHYAREKLKDVPTVYHAQLPETDDPVELAAAEQTIRARYREDLKAAGHKVPDVGHANPGGYTAAEAARTPDYSKMPATKKVESLIASSRPAFVGTGGEPQPKTAAAN